MTDDDFNRLREEFDVVPFVREVSADFVTPVAAFAALSHWDPAAGGESFLFESVERGENLGRYSFVGFAPRRTLTFDRQSVDPVGTLQKELVPLRVYGEQSLPPFFGGAVGYFGYGVAGWGERIPDHGRDDLGTPLAKLLFFDNVVAFDHVRQRMHVVVNLFTSDPHASPAEAEARLERAVSILRAAQIDPIEFACDANEPAMQPEQSRAEFEAMVREAKEEIAAGEIFQIVLSQRWSAPYPADEALTLYRVLRSVNPSPYMFLLRTQECTLVGSSPEMLVRVTGSQAETRPIAGTRPRGRTADEDAQLAQSLHSDPKENAEHLMLVDLGRNDLGRVSRPGSVEVTGFSRLERYSHVMHLVSDVRSVVREDQTPISVFLSCFPAGTVSGAPKIRAMELIDRFERTARGPYAGAVAYIGFSGNLDSCITIRTIVLARGKAWVQAGAGIVYDSDPGREWEETVNKSAALRYSVGVARALLSKRTR